MNPQFYLKTHYPVIYAVLLLLLPAVGLRAQICQNPTDTIYGLNLTGVLTPINVNNATLGISPDSLTDGNVPSNSNGLGFSKLNGRFYYFERSAAGAPNSQRFVYYDPATETVLGRMAPPFAGKVRSGCVNTAGNGYYTIDPTGPTLYYFNILTNTWTTVTSVFKDPSNVDISATFSSLNSGDMAFDGAGNLWILVSNAAKFGLYEISAAVPSTAVASVTATQIIAPTTATPTGFSVTGLAFNATGALYLSTGSGDNKLFKMSSASSPLVLVGTLPINEVASDLTSCAYPMWVLATSWLGFDAVLKKEVELSWSSMEDKSIAGYRVEYSTDAEHWKTLAIMAKSDFNDGVSATYHYTDGQYAAGTNFYRIAQVSDDGKAVFSTVKSVNTTADQKISIGPNPASDVLHVYNDNVDGNNKYLAQVFDGTGRLVYYTILQQAQSSINISHLPKGSYVLKLTSSANQSVSSHHFLKW